MKGQITKCCPKCEGTAGYSVELRESVGMIGEWGENPEADDPGRNPVWSLATCLDCGVRFRFRRVCIPDE
jgi:hypothetical protein